ncbi:MAG TPA: gluconeogenesis factor YvcK family protein, partial [Burkholderiales bacterium]|nr:gluconeogenesis factor YvcK family protein [Burkholderiales bacterium]
MELARRGLDVTRIAPPWDSGGSSKPIRERLQLLAVGDIRNALMALAHGEGRAGPVVRVCNTRLSDSEDRAALERELEYYVEGARLGEPIIGYLRRFSAAVGPGFDLRRGSLGNFVLAGAWLAHHKDINAAISVFRTLCSIQGNVWPTSTDNDLQLEAVLNNGVPVHGQHRITALDAAHARVGIREIRLVRGAGAQAQANERALEALAGADAIVFGPGSFYTSVLPHVLVPGVARALAPQKAPVILVGNMLECPETVGLSLNRMLAAFLAHAPLTHVLANRSPTPFQRSVGGYRYIAFDAQDPLLERQRVQALWRDFEDPWQRGIHQPALVAAA